jgi:prevent-host-death family protein
MEARIVDLRYRMKDVLRALERGETVTVLHRGKPKARIVPIEPERLADPREAEGFGMWKDREDMKDPVEWVRKTRRRWRRHV